MKAIKINKEKIATLIEYYEKLLSYNKKVTKFI